ncbi:MAG: TetR/AcrR family transcriptional regulator [Pseudomonadota bacterium]|jgi:AcrR family transcriptional regulator|nr:TetR/AcrR family transcriptional regulator [Afipia sp.]
MSTLRLTGDLRREQILEAAKGCFALYGFAGTTTRSVARAAGISEGLLFKHFPTKAALYAEILAEACEADPELLRLRELKPSTETLVILIREMVVHFMRAPDEPDQEDAQRIRLLISSQLNDGEFARVLYDKIGDLIGPIFSASLESAIAAGDAERVEGEPLNLFWFAHQVVHMIALTRLPATPSLDYPNAPDFERQICQFILRGIGMNGRAISSYLDTVPSLSEAAVRIVESA